jgi:hypothetical protein
MSVVLNNKNFVAKECPTCGIDYYMPEVFENECRRDIKQTWYCPNGHPRVYRENEADTLRRERDRLVQKLAQKDDEIAAQRQAKITAQRSAVANKEQVTRLKNRAKAGLCSCCNRHFENLERHMASKHKDGATVQ